MRIDKKSSGNEKKVVLLSRIGATYELKATVVQDAVISKALAPAVRLVAGTPSKNPVKMSTPGSKSISNRALVLAALGKGSCRLKNLLHSDDTQVMMTALVELKVCISNEFVVYQRSWNPRALDLYGKTAGKRLSSKVEGVLFQCPRVARRFTWETPVLQRVS